MIKQTTIYIPVELLNCLNLDWEYTRLFNCLLEHYRDKIIIKDNSFIKMGKKEKKIITVRVEEDYLKDIKNVSDYFTLILKKFIDDGQEI